ncbi:hypothetical protein K439DRAFT_1621416 [Ramaria rubella]|nr:hypothetical protein K439DRAFT_1621416 [Ramaria rubella]
MAQSAPMLLEDCLIWSGDSAAAITQHRNKEHAVAFHHIRREWAVPSRMVKVNDGQFVQPLTTLEIESLKRSGVCIEDIIRAQIKQHANYALQTEYSKDEYRKRKETKYSKSFTTLEPTLWHIAEYWFMKDPTRIREMLTLANIHLGGHYLVVDNGGGILVAGVLERLGDEQRSLACVHTGPAPPPRHQQHRVATVCLLRPVTHELSTIVYRRRDALDQPGRIQIMLANRVSPVDAEPEVVNDKQRIWMVKCKRTQDKIYETREDPFEGSGMRKWAAHHLVYVRGMN